MANGPQEKGDDRAPSMKNFSWPFRAARDDVDLRPVLAALRDFAVVDRRDTLFFALPREGVPALRDLATDFLAGRRLWVLARSLWSFSPRPGWSALLPEQSGVASRRLFRQRRPQLRQ